MSVKVKYTGVAIMLVIFAACTVSADEGRIFGKIYTDRGDVLEGPIRWDKNEGSWIDMIDGQKEVSRKAEREKRRKYRDDDDTEISLFGVTILKTGSSWNSSRQSCIAFGNIDRLTPESNNGATLLLKSGEEVLIESSSTDLGSGIREIVIEDEKEGEIELDWYDIDYIEFMDGGNVTSNFGERIFGTVKTSRAGEYTGWICWDMDELFMEDIIDGSDRKRKRKIKFDQIEMIEKISSRASRIVLKNGKEIRLDDSNDVDSGNRGIIVSDFKLGRVVVGWDEFESLTIKEPGESDFIRYKDFDGGHRLRGTVYDEDGESHAGDIRWDNDEEYSWEALDGDYRGVELDVTFGNIKSIKKLSSRSSQVTLWDGREFKLRDSNDVNDENNGIFVTKDKNDETVVDWNDFDHIEFEKR